MRRGFKWPLIAEVLIGGFMIGLIFGTIAFVRTLRYGFSAHDEPTMMEASIAGQMRHWSVPAGLHALPNPVPLTSNVLEAATAHWADHCASCHGNDGKGKTDLGMKLYPRAPDMTLSETQTQSDGELFATIENGVRLTGMPGWGNGTAESAYGTWTLVHFIRHLSKLTPGEIEAMVKLNPKSPDEYAEMKSEESFLEGGDATVSASDTKSPTHEHH